MSERFKCPGNVEPIFPDQEVSVIEEDEKRMVRSVIEKIKTSRPGFEGYDFGYIHLAMVCSGVRRAGVKHTEIFEKNMREKGINMEDVCKKCNEPERMKWRNK
jgi:hypothetical protein